MQHRHQVRPWVIGHVLAQPAYDIGAALLRQAGIARCAMHRQPMMQRAVTRLHLELNDLVLVTRCLDIGNRRQVFLVKVVINERDSLETLPPAMRPADIFDSTAFIGDRIEGQPESANLVPGNRPVILACIGQNLCPAHP